MKPDIQAFVAANPAWTYQNEILVGDWKLADFAAVRQIVSQLCDLADEHNHHPVVTYGYNTLHVETTTHDAGNLVTQKDIDLALAISKLVGE
jgi:4a-hydroxytetrahydrobiopterin dehydratase